MAEYSNPVVRGHAPDPSIVRVGDDFFLVSSSFRALPGLPIRHSTDLVNWRIIGHAITRPAQYRRDGLHGPMTLFAPTIRHHDGRFHVVCTNPHPGQGNFLVSTDDPAGEWSDAVWIDEEAFDPSLFRDDDGTWYYTRRSLRFGRPDGNLGAIVQAEIDLDSGALGPLRDITADARGFVTNDVEGPHLFRRGDWYYLTAAEGSSWKGHLQSIGRSRSPWGPFEPAPHNPVLTHRDRVGHPIQSLGHADFVQAADGSWWAVALGTRHAPLSQHHNIGRETFLLPVEWRDDWPVVGSEGGTELRVEGVSLPIGSTVTAVTAAPDTLWTRGWMTHDRPAEGARTIENGIELAAGSALHRWQTGDDQRFAATVEPAPGATAGIEVRLDEGHTYAATVSVDVGRRVVRLRRQADDLVAEESVVLPGTGPVRLEIRARADAYTFQALVEGEEVALGAGSARLLSAESAEWFVATHFGLVCRDADATFTDIVHDDLPPLPLRFRLPF